MTPGQIIHARRSAVLDHAPKVAPRSRLNFIKVSELRLPELGTRISLVVREGPTYVPDDPFRLRTGDQLLIVVARDVFPLMLTRSPRTKKGSPAGLPPPTSSPSTSLTRPYVVRLRVVSHPAAA